MVHDTDSNDTEYNVFYKPTFFLHFTCNKYLNDPDNGCVVTENMIGDTFHNLEFVLCVVGFFNNLIAVGVFYQPRYNSKLFPSLLRAFYLCNLLVTITIGADTCLHFWEMFHPEHEDLIHIFERGNQFATATAMKTAVGVLACIAIVRFLYFTNPFMSIFHNKPYRHTCIIVIFFLLLSLSMDISYRTGFIAVQEVDHTIEQTEAIYNLAAVTVCLGSHLAWNIWKARRKRKQREEPGRQNVTAQMLKRLSTFIILSNILFATTTIPISVFLLLPSTLVAKSCRVCINVRITNCYLILLFSLNFYLDNMLYVILSKEYRQEASQNIKSFFVKTKSCFCCRANPSSVVSLPSRRMTQMRYAIDQESIVSSTFVIPDRCSSKV